MSRNERYEDAGNRERGKKVGMEMVFGGSRWRDEAAKKLWKWVCIGREFRGK